MRFSLPFLAICFAVASFGCSREKSKGELEKLRAENEALKKRQDDLERKLARGQQLPHRPDEGQKDERTPSKLSPLPTTPLDKGTEVMPPSDKGTKVQPPPKNGPGNKSKLYVASFGANYIQVFDTTSFKLLKIVEVGPNPHGLVATAAAERIFITIENVHGKVGELLWYDPVTDSVSKRMKVGPRPHQPACTPDGKFVYVPCDDGSWWVVDADRAAVVKKIATGGRPHTTVCSADGQFMYLSPSGGKGPYHVSIAELATHKLVGNIPFSNAPRSIVLSQDGKRLYATVDKLIGFEVADVPNRKLLHRVQADVPAEVRSLPSRCDGIGLRPGDKELWMCDFFHDRTYVFDLTVLPPKQVASVTMLKGGGSCLCFSPDGRFCCISERIGNGVTAVDTKLRQVLAQTYPGKIPQGVLVIPETR